jgi:hypothetical protein
MLVSRRQDVILLATRDNGGCSTLLAKREALPLSRNRPLPVVFLIDNINNIVIIE